MNANRAEMEALIRAFSRMREKCELSIYTDSEYLFNGFAGREDVTRWVKSGWITTRGQPVKNKDKWLELMHRSAEILRFPKDQSTAECPKPALQ